MTKSGYRFHIRDATTSSVVFEGKTIKQCSGHVQKHLPWLSNLALFVTVLAFGRDGRGRRPLVIAYFGLSLGPVTLASSNAPQKRNTSAGFRSNRIRAARERTFGVLKTRNLLPIFASLPNALYLNRSIRFSDFISYSGQIGSFVAAA